LTNPALPFYSDVDGGFNAAGEFEKIKFAGNTGWSP